MPAGANYGFNSLPTEIIGGEEYADLKNTVYSNYSCTQVVQSGNTQGSIKYIDEAHGEAALTYLIPSGGTLNMIIEPERLLEATGVYFLCACSNCDDAMTGTTQYNNTGYAYPRTNDGSGNLTHLKTFGGFAPTIIGGGGLNN
tara:strand:- start:438 stop:866 length:429 start_codon:yes stop_codon:yes gene_type:complete